MEDRECAIQSYNSYKPEPRTCARCGLGPCQLYLARTRPEEGFANHPATMGELRADKNENAAAWAPRDVLINVLRAIDSKEIEPDALVVCYSRNSGETTGWRASSPNVLTTVGMLELTKARVLS